MNIENYHENVSPVWICNLEHILRSIQGQFGT